MDIIRYIKTSFIGTVIPTGYMQHDHVTNHSEGWRCVQPPSSQPAQALYSMLCCIGIDTPTATP